MNILKYVNYIVISFMAYLVIYGLNLLPIWTILLTMASCFLILTFVNAIDEQDNVYLFSFLISIPFVLYWTEESNEVASQNIWVLLSTIALCVSLPFVFILLFDLWRLAGERD